MKRAITESDVAVVSLTRAAELLQMDRGTVRELIANRELPAAKFGGDTNGVRYRIRLRDLDELLTNRAA